MGQVYAHAFCVIVATASANAHGGCFRDRPPRWMEQTIMTSATKRCFISNLPSIRELLYWRVELAPLTKRAWAFQERLLARRVVHFCEGVVLFERNTLQASEFDVFGVIYSAEPYRVRNGKLVERYVDEVPSGGPREQQPVAVRGIRGALDVLVQLGPASEQSFAEKVEFYKRWYEVVWRGGAGAREGTGAVPGWVVGVNGIAVGVAVGCPRAPGEAAPLLCSVVVMGVSQGQNWVPPKELGDTGTYQDGY